MDNPVRSQLDLFDHIAASYAEASDGTLNNAALYKKVAERAGIDRAAMDARIPIGAAASLRSPTKRKIRWFQQTLKQLGVIERVEGKRGIWRLIENPNEDLNKIIAGVKLVAFSTRLGVAIWSRHQDVFSNIDEPISLCVTSPPYPLRNSRAYGNPDEAGYVDFICEALEPIIRQLIPGGSVVLNLSNDIFLSKSPARSLYLERLIIALNDRLGLSLMDRLPWVNLSKPPGPTYWACVNRVQLTTAYEPVLWFTNDPMRVRSDNRRVLERHTERHLHLMQAGGAKRTAEYGDGAYKIRPDSYGRITEGKIPRNVIQRGHSCSDTLAYRQYATELDLPLHGAMQPTSIPDFFIRFLTEPDDLVVDAFGGTIRTGLAAERLGRRWLVTEWILQYLRGAAELFRESPGFWLNPLLANGMKKEKHAFL